MQTHRKAPKGQTGLYLGFESNFCFFCMPYSGHQGQSNEVTRQLSKLPLHLGCGGCCEPLVESKLNLVKYLTMQHLDFFLEYHFLKLVN